MDYKWERNKENTILDFLPYAEYLKNLQIGKNEFVGDFYNLHFLASSKNLARPMSVKGCFNNPKIESKGQEQTSTPASAALTIWKALRIEAANICVANSCTS